MKKCIYLAILLFLKGVVISCSGGSSYSGAAQDSAANKQTGNFDNKPQYALQGDTSFAIDAAGNELAEMALANLALQQSNDSTVKEFAQFMIDDHSKVYKELQDIALEKKMILPVVLPTEHQKKLMT